MDIPLVNVTARISDQQGRPVHRAQIVMRLTTVERYCGLIVPREARAETDPQGRAVLKVWPNEQGTESSEYMVTVTFPEAGQVNGGKHPSHLPPLHSLRYHATVPNADCNLHDIAEMPPYEQRGAGQVITSEVAAQRAESAGDCAKADAQRAETAADAVGKHAIIAKDAAAAMASATGADESARMALDAKQAVTEHRAHVDEVTADLDAAIAGAAAGIVTDRSVSDAVDAATAEATTAAGRAEQSATAADASATSAQAKAERAGTAANQADDAAQRAAEFAGKLEHEFNAETSVARMATELVTLSDRFTKSILAGLQNELTTARMQDQFVQLSDRVTGMEMRAVEGN